MAGQTHDRTRTRTQTQNRMVVADGDHQREVLVSLRKVVALTHAAGFSIASDGSPWEARKTERNRERQSEVGQRGGI